MRADDSEVETKIASAFIADCGTRSYKLKDNWNMPSKHIAQ